MSTFIWLDCPRRFHPRPKRSTNASKMNFSQVFPVGYIHVVFSGCFLPLNIIFHNLNCFSGVKFGFMYFLQGGLLNLYRKNAIWNFCTETKLIYLSVFRYLNNVCIFLQLVLLSTYFIWFMQKRFYNEINIQIY